VLVICGSLWEADETSAVEQLGEDLANDLLFDGIVVEDEITGQYCVECERLTSLSLNTGM